MTYILKAGRRMRRFPGMALGGITDGIIGASNPADYAPGASGASTNSVDPNATNASGKPYVTPPSSGGSSIWDTVGSGLSNLVSGLTSNALPRAPTTVVVQAPGMSTGTKIAIGAGFLGLVAIIATRS